MAALVVSLLCNSLHVPLKVLSDLLLGISHHSGIPRIHADVFQVIGLGEKRDLRKSTDPCNKGELDVFIEVFEHSEEGLQELTVAVCYLQIMKMINNRLVILINEHYHASLASKGFY